MSQAPRKSTRATKGQPPEILDPAKGLGLASSKDTRESNAAEPLAGEADVLTTPRKDAIPASTVLGGSSPAKIVAKRPGLSVHLSRCPMQGCARTHFAEGTVDAGEPAVQHASIRIRPAPVFSRFLAFCF